MTKAQYDAVGTKDAGTIYMVETPVVIETYTNGTSWYRKWSDGWIEQGGILEGASSNPKVVTLLVSMSNTAYHIQLTSQYTTTATAVPCVSDNASYLKTSSSFYVYNSTVTTYDAYWEVKGY
jgi:hypothetical protein